MTKSNDRILDVAVVGAGVAGLTTAYRLADLDVEVFEREPVVGGRTKVVDLAGAPAYTGAGVVYNGTPTHALVRELGIAIFQVAPTSYALHALGVTVVARTDGEVVAGLPLSDRGRRELRRVLTKIRAEYGEFSHAGLTDASSALLDQSFADYLGDIDPAVAQLMRRLTFAHCMAWPEELSAKYALRYLSSKLVGDDTHMSFIVKGMHQIALRLREKVTGPVHLETTVGSVVRRDGAFTLEVTGPRGPRTVRARQVVMAVPGPSVPGLVPDLPRSNRDGIDAIESVPGLTMAVVLAADEQAAWKDVFYAPTLDVGFDYLCDCRYGPEKPEGPTIWQLGVWRERAVEQSALDDDTLRERWLDDLEKVFPGARANVLGTYVQRWPAGFAIPKANRSAVLADARRSVDGLHFTGDWASESAGTHGAIQSAYDAVDQVRARHQALAATAGSLA